MNKFKTHILVLFLIYILSESILAAEVILPLQIFLPGNFNGKTVELTDKLSFSLSDAHKIPELIATFKKEEKNTLVFATGNNSSIYEPLSFLLNGKIENELIKKCNPNVFSASPSDIEILDLKGDKKHLKNLLFTNAVSKKVPHPFKTFETANVGDKTIYFFNFISASLCENLPIQKWESFEADDFQRTLRRLEFEFKDSDITISTVYGSKEETENLVLALKRLNGTHFVINATHEKDFPFYPFTTPIIEGNVYKFSLKNGNTALPLLNIIFKNSGSPRITLRMLPLNKFDNSKGDNTLSAFEKQINDYIFEPFRIITTKEKASTSANYIRADAHATLTKRALNTDLAIMIEPNQRHINNNVINLGRLLKAIENDRIFIVRLKGATLKKLTEKLVSAYGKDKIAIAGCEFEYFAGKTVNFKVSGISVDSHKTYSVATTQATLGDSIARNVFEKDMLQPFNGYFLWDIWKNNLKIIKMANDVIFE
ncbi:MAG: hypothetical protein PHF29_04705 [Candidatus Riflebacteria bacterium]|nr:hypothetical protein [Candidatus Riflebacteria bacterium]